MYLASITVENFRSFKQLQVELQPGLNVLVGRNNTGKTTLLHAIRHAIGPASTQGDSLWLTRDDFYRSSDAADPATSMSVTLTFKALSETQRAHFFECVDFDLANLDNSTAVIRFEASWPKGKRQPSIKRTGGPVTAEPTEVPTNILQSLPITFLPALRDAEAALAPGYRSRLAVLLSSMAEHTGPETEAEIVDIFSKANSELEKHKLVSDTVASLQATTQTIAGTDHTTSTINTAELNFEKILRTLQVQMKAVPIGSLAANGLGFNNLLYIAVVLEHLKGDFADEFPLLLVEEPEAHLHPQLTMLLAEYLAAIPPGKKGAKLQTLVTTHSPTLAASVPPNQIHVLFSGPSEKELCCNSVAKAGMDPKEQSALQRMLDITRATLYFSKGAILVEGISESLLIPVLAKRLGYDLAKEHISVIPICGVAFETFKKLLDPKVLGIPIAIVTDADPPVPRKSNWEDEEPELEGAAFKICDRTKKLIEVFTGHGSVIVKHSKLTLEYDLAAAGDDNAATMAAVWETCFQRTPGTFNSGRVAQAGAVRHDKAMAAWRGICRADPSVSKAEFAHRLSTQLQDDQTFAIPGYLQEAIEYVVNSLRNRSSGGGSAKP